MSMMSKGRPGQALDLGVTWLVVSEEDPAPGPPGASVGGNARYETTARRANATTAMGNGSTSRVATPAAMYAHEPTPRTLRKRAPRPLRWCLRIRSYRVAMIVLTVAPTRKTLATTVTKVPAVTDPGDGPRKAPPMVECRTTATPAMRTAASKERLPKRRRGDE